MSTTGRSKATASSTTAIMAYKHQSTKTITAYEHHSYSGSSGHHSSCAKELSKPKKPEKPKEVTLKVNCTCNKCLSSIIKALNSLKGVDSVEIGANREMVKIRGSATEEECIKEIKKLGKAVQKWPKDETKGDIFLSPLPFRHASNLSLQFKHSTVRDGMSAGGSNK